MGHMFMERHSLEHLDLSTFDTSSIKDIDLSNFNTSKVTGMQCMFRNCKGLEYLDIYNFDMSNVEHKHNMFNGCTNLKEIKLPKEKHSRQMLIGQLKKDNIQF